MSIRENICFVMNSLNAYNWGIKDIDFSDCVTPASIPQHFKTFTTCIYIVMLVDFFFQIKRKVMITFKILKEIYKLLAVFPIFFITSR